LRQATASTPSVASMPPQPSNSALQPLPYKLKDAYYKARTFAAGLTVHAGGLPVISLLFAWGGQEDSHTTANVSSTLLGGSIRPSLF